MTPPKIEKLPNTYTPFNSGDGTVQVPFINSAFACDPNQKVGNGNPIGDQLAGNVGGEGENPEQPVEQPKPLKSMSLQSTGDSLCGVSVDQLKSSLMSRADTSETFINDILQKMSTNELKQLVGERVGMDKDRQEYIDYILSNNDAKRLVLDKVPKEEIINYYKKVINEARDEFDEFLSNFSEDVDLHRAEKERIFEEVIVPHILRHGKTFDVSTLASQLDLAIQVSGEDILADPEKAKACLFVYENLGNSGCIDLVNKRSGLAETLGIDIKKSTPEEITKALKNYLDNIVNESGLDPDNPQCNDMWLGELARLALCSETAEEKKLINDFIKNYEGQIKKISNSDTVTADLLKVIMESCSSKEVAIDVYHHMSQDAKDFLPKEIVQDMLKEYQEGGIFYDLLSPEEKERLEQIQAKIDSNEQISEDDNEFLTKINKIREMAREAGENLGEAVILRSGEDGDFTPEERSEAIQTICEGIKHIDQSTYEEFLNNIHTWYEEHKDELDNLNIPEEIFTQLMIDASGGEYTTAIQPPIEGNAGGYEPSAYNQEAGIGFNNVTIPPNLVGPYNIQEYYAQLNEAYLSDNADEQNQLPQYVGTDNNPELPNASITIVNTREECDKVALLDILSGKVALGDISLMSYILEKFKVSDIAEKGRCLAEACDKYLNMLIDATENSVAVITSFFASGGKGNCFARTRELQRIVDKENERNQHIQAPTCSMA